MESENYIEKKCKDQSGMEVTPLYMKGVHLACEVKTKGGNTYEVLRYADELTIIEDHDP